MAAIKVWNRTLDPRAEMAGTLTCVLPLAHSPQRWMAVSAAHVLAPLVAPGRTGPSSGDRVAFATRQGELEGALWYWCDLQREIDGFSNAFDAALVELSAEDARTLLAELNQPPSWTEPGVGSALTFEGVSSGASSGRFEGQRTAAPIDYAVLGGLFAGVSFANSLRARLPARAGDSGALLHEGGRAVGMLVGAEGEQARFLPLAPMLDAFGLAWPRASGAAALAPLAPSTPPPAPPAAMRSALPAAVIGNDRALAADTLARTLWGEARGEPLKGLRAVAAVVLNRALHPRVRWWGRSVIGVCRAPWQFSCWNAKDPNLPRLLALKPADRHYQVCLAVAEEALGGELAGEQRLGATHYHTKAIRPKWSRGRVPCADIGAHLFYNDIE